MTGLPVTTRQRIARRLSVDERTAPYLLLIPTLLLFAVTKVYPFLASAWLSLTSSRAGGGFVGFDNFVRLFQDPLFYKAIGNTFLFTIIQVPVMLTIALLLGVAFNSLLLRMRVTLRLIYFLPIVMGLVAYGVLFRALFANDYGTINFILQSIGLPQINWLGDPGWARVSIMLAWIWHYTGYFAVIFLAQRQSIPEELFEAAETDGASVLQRFRHITIPGMRPAIILTAVLATTGTLQLFDEPYVLTGGGPDNATLTIGMYLYFTGFRYIDFGYASAIGWVLAVVIGIVGVIQLRLLGGRR